MIFHLASIFFKDFTDIIEVVILDGWEIRKFLGWLDFAVTGVISVGIVICFFRWGFIIIWGGVLGRRDRVSRSCGLVIGVIRRF